MLDALPDATPVLQKKNWGTPTVSGVVGEE